MDPVFRTIFRQAEQTDARLGIRRDEKQEDGRRKEGGEEDSPSEASFDESRPVVSVAALIAFLEGLVQTLRMKAPPPPTPDYAVPAMLPPREAASSSEGKRGRISAPAHAASVYKSVAEGRTRRPSEEGGDSVESSLAVPGQAEALSVEDIRMIHGLLEKLKTLRAETLTIGKAPTFLQSLSEAADRVKETES